MFRTMIVALVIIAGAVTRNAAAEEIFVAVPDQRIGDFRQVC